MSGAGRSVGAGEQATVPALVWEGGTDIAVRDVSRPRNRPGWTLVDVAYAGICGSDLHVCAGAHPRARPGVVPGHEMAGVVAGDGGVLPRGTKVFVNPMIHCGVCDACVRGLVHVCQSLTAIGIDHPGALCPQVLVPDYGLYPLAEDLDLRRAALIEPVAVAVRAVARSGVRLGDRVHVLGAGPIGCLVALLARVGGAGTVTVSEIAPERRERAAALGLTVTDPDVADRSADVVVDASGHPSVAPGLTSWIRPGGTVTLVGAYPPGPQQVDLLSFMFGELRLVGTRIYTRPDIEAAIDVVTDSTVDVHALVSEILPLSEAVTAIQTLRSGRGMKILIQPER